MGIFAFAPKAKPLDVAVSVNTDEMIRQEHRRLAEKHGCPTVCAVSLESVIREECIHVFDQAKVEKWMDKKGEWRWFPLRSRDRGRVEIQRVSRIESYRMRDHGGMESNVYPLIVPVPVLMTVDRLDERLRGEVFFYVAAPSQGPDPFLAAVSRENIFIVERWDEPGFRG